MNLGNTLAVVALVAGLFIWPLPNGGNQLYDGCVPTHVPKIEAAVPVGDELVADERGFSIVKRPTVFSMGASVRNRGSRAAYHTAVRFRLVGAAGAVVWEGKPHELSVIRAGQLVSVGEVADLYYSYEAVKVVGVELRFETTHWVEDDPENRLIQMTYDSDFRTYERDSNAAYVSYGTVAPYGCRGLSMRSIAYTYRDARGIIVGGSTEAMPRQLDTCNGMHLGTAVWIGPLPDGVDLGQSRRTTYCDIAA
ncbi:hypothetical protein [Dactylosporangium salmoneum]|uniref:Uncharacterized protein n=1 Tax=Dactylosporangium salmoneum TaxID=53361 RepID=A0ABN3FF85_9ACTN